MRQLLPDLTEKWPTELIHKNSIGSFQIPPPVLDEKNNEIVHEYFWNKLPNFIPENSIVVAETGTSEFGEFSLLIFISNIENIFKGFSICVHRKV